MGNGKPLVPRPIYEYTSKLRFPKLFALVVILFILDLLLPDFIPFVDELILAVVALFLGRLKRRIRREIQGSATTSSATSESDPP